MLKLSFLQFLLLLLLLHSGSSVLLGWVESPGYPSGYPPHASLNWSRCAPKGHTISLRLIHLDLEDSQDCENDALKIFSDGNLISILCGKRQFEELQTAVNPSLQSSPGGCLSLTFHSDYSNTKRHTGFKGFYTVRDFDECEDDPGCTQYCHNFIGGYHCSCSHGYHLVEDKHTCTVNCTKDLSGLNRGVISSPFWPGSYAENSNCKYILSVDPHLQLELHFSEDFDVEQSADGQCIDGLRVETPSGTLGPFCGSTPPPSPLLTHSNKIHIHFTSDSFGSNKGFSLHYKTQDKVCPQVVSPHSTVTPKKPEYLQGEMVTVTCKAGHELDTQGVQADVSQFTTTCQSTGIWSPSFICERVECDSPDIPEDGILKVESADNQQYRYKDQIHFNCSSKYYTLEGDDTYTCNANAQWESSSGKTEMPKCTEVCGRPETEEGAAGRILGGEFAKLGEIPWQLLIKSPSRAGASLINDRWAVTAAHVVEKLSDTSLVLYGGVVDVKSTNNKGTEVASQKIIIHPGFDTMSTRTNYNNDIALIRFADRVNLGTNLLPICLPEPNTGVSENELGTVSGWGVTETRLFSNKLKHATIGVYSLKRCQDTPSMSDGRPMTFTDNMFCAGAEGRDSCKRDSGGGFFTPTLAESVRPFRLTGIVSWGSDCREGNYKGYYTKVENYVNWIKDTIDATEKSLQMEE